MAISARTGVQSRRSGREGLAALAASDSSVTATAGQNNGANGTAPHADSRDIKFDINGDLLEVDDGGIYRLTNPTVAGRTWSSLNASAARPRTNPPW